MNNDVHKYIGIYCNKLHVDIDLFTVMNWWGMYFIHLMIPYIDLDYWIWWTVWSDENDVTQPRDDQWQSRQDKLYCRILTSIMLHLQLWRLWWWQCDLMTWQYWRAGVDEQRRLRSVLQQYCWEWWVYDQQYWPTTKHIEETGDVDVIDEMMWQWALIVKASLSCFWG